MTPSQVRSHKHQQQECLLCKMPQAQPRTRLRLVGLQLQTGLQYIEPVSSRRSKRSPPLLRYRLLDSLLCPSTGPRASAQPRGSDHAHLAAVVYLQAPSVLAIAIVPKVRQRDVSILSRAIRDGSSCSSTKYWGGRANPGKALCASHSGLKAVMWLS